MKEPKQMGMIFQKDVYELTSLIAIEVAVGTRMYSIITNTVVNIPQLVQATNTSHQKILSLRDLASRANERPWTWSTNGG